MPDSFVTDVNSKDEGTHFAIQVGPPEADAARSGDYHLPDMTHESCADFHVWMSKNFGLSMPVNKREKVATNFHAAFRPVLTENISPDILYGYGDPCVTRVDDASSPTGVFYYLVCTSNDAPNSFPILKSDNLVDWDLENFAFPEGNKPVWVKDGRNVSDFWAPEVHKVGDRYVMCFTAREKDGTLAIGLAASDHPAGPFQAGEKSILTGGVIDGHIFVEDDGSAWLFWKEDNNDAWPILLVGLMKEEPQVIDRIFNNDAAKKTSAFLCSIHDWLVRIEPMCRAQMLGPLIDEVTDDYIGVKNGLIAFALTHKDRETEIGKIVNAMSTPFYMEELDPVSLELKGERRVVIHNDQVWESHLIEGMYLFKADAYYLFYSGNDFATDKYGIGVAVSESLFGPYVKNTEPFLRSTGLWSGPGHPSVTRDLNGDPVLILHGFKPGTGGYKVFRALLLAHLNFANRKVTLVS